MSPFRTLLSSTALVLLCAFAFAGDLEDGQALVAKGDFEAALPKFEQAVKAQPDNADAAQGLAEVLSGLGRQKEAIKVANEGLKKHKDHVGLSLAKARAYMLSAETVMRNRGDHNLILAHAADCDAALRVVLEADKDHADGNVLRAKVIQHQGGAEEGLALLVAQSKKHPKHFDTWWEIGQHWFRAAGANNKNKTLWANGEAAFRKAFEADPTSGWAIQRATLCAHWQGTAPLELAKGYEQAALLLPGHANTLKQLNATLRSQPEKRLAAFERVHKKFPDDAEVTHWYARVLRDTGKADVAFDLIKKAEKAHPDNATIRSDLGDMLSAQGKLDEAIGKYEEALQLRKGVYHRDDYAKVLKLSASNQTNREQKEKLWTALWKAYPNVLYAPNNAGLYYRDVFKNPKESLKWYLRASEAAPLDVQVLNDTGLIYHYELKDYENALPFYERAVESALDQGIEPGTSGVRMGFRDALVNLGKVLTELERWDDMKSLVEDDLPEGFPLLNMVGRILVDGNRRKQMKAFVEKVVPKSHPSYEAWKKFGDGK